MRARPVHPVFDWSMLSPMPYRFVTFGLLYAALAPTAFAHPELGSYLQHRIILRADADHVALVIEVSFDGERSLRERESIDSDKSGTLSKPEREAYLHRIEAEAEQRIRLTVNNESVRLVPLYAPELDLFDSRDMERHPHLLRLSYFAPVKCAPGDVITIDDTLWPDYPAIMLAEPGGREGLKPVPRQPRSQGIGNTTPATREVSFDISAVARADSRTPRQSCAKSCSRPMLSNGRPRGH